jgi:hypothetical protein
VLILASGAVASAANKDASDPPSAPSSTQTLDASTIAQRTQVITSAVAAPTGMPVQSHRAPAQAPPGAAATAATAAGGYGCGPALAYLRTNAAPGFELQCPGNAYGHQAMTCVNTAPQCPSRQVIAIHVPCPAAYMNEASNSWVLLGLRHTRIDPYGYCH